MNEIFVWGGDFVDFGPILFRNPINQLLLSDSVILLASAFVTVDWRKQNGQNIPGLKPITS